MTDTCSQRTSTAERPASCNGSLGRRWPKGSTAQNRAALTPPSPYRSLMAGATHNNRERRAEARRPTDDEQFPERLAASMQRHRRILDRLAGEAE